MRTYFIMKPSTEIYLTRRLFPRLLVVLYRDEYNIMNKKPFIANAQLANNRGNHILW